MDELISRLRAVSETGCEPDLPHEAADAIAALAQRAEDAEQLAAARGHTIQTLQRELSAVKVERDELAAKLRELEGQKPVAWIGYGPRDGRVEFSISKPVTSVFRDFGFKPLFARPVPAEQGHVTVTTDDTGRCIMVSRQDEDHQILSVIWEAPEQAAVEPVNARLLSVLKAVRDRFFPADEPERDRDIQWDEVNEVIAAAEAQQAELVDERVIDRTWVRFCGAFGDGPDAPYPGMIATFETHYGQSFRDKAWRTEAACWAAAWSKATARAESSLSAPQSDALEQVRAEEREACAKVCDEVFPPPGEQMAVEWAAGTIACANAIRARGQK